MAKKQKDFKTFEQWHYLDVEKSINISLCAEPSPGLINWTNVEPYIPDEWQFAVNVYRKKLLRLHGFWNETELAGQFIIPYLLTLDWFTNDFNIFHERPLKAKVKGYSVHGIVDGMVASGSYEPGKPYFFLHEYKRMKAGDADPLGQLLIAMLAAQSLNNDGKPIYGCYMVGCAWRFVLLENTQYSLSQAYDLTDETEIQIVWAILKRTKDYIEIRVKEDIEAGIIK